MVGYVDMVTPRALWNWLSWQRVPARDIPLRQARLEGVFATAYAFFFVAASWVTGELILRWPCPIHHASSFTQDLWYVAFFKGILLLIVPIAAYRRLGYGVGDLLLGWRLTFRSMLTCILAFGAGFCLNLKHLEWIGQAAAGRESGVVFPVTLGALLALLTASVPEEFVYRYLLQTRLEVVAGRFVGIVGTALLFAAWHIPTRYLLAGGVEGQAGNLSSVLYGTGVPVFVVGLAFGILWDRYRNLPALVAGHWGIDVLPAVSSQMGVNF